MCYSRIISHDSANCVRFLCVHRKVRSSLTAIGLILRENFVWPFVACIDGALRNLVLERSHPSALPVFRLLKSSVAFTFWKQREWPALALYVDGMHGMHTKQRSAQVTSQHSGVTSRVILTARLREREMHKCDMRCQRCIEIGCNMWHVTYWMCFVMLLHFSGTKTLWVKAVLQKSLRHNIFTSNRQLFSVARESHNLLDFHSNYNEWIFEESRIRL